MADIRLLIALSNVSPLVLDELDADAVDEVEDE
jgi:hypothetical protein